MWPFLVHNNLFVLPTYIFVDSLAFCFGLLWVVHRAQKFSASRKDTLDVALVVMMGAFVGSRAFHIFFEQPRFYLMHPTYIFAFWYGGFVFYGGVIGALALGALLWRVRRFDFPQALDLFAPVVSAGYAFGRLGCLAAGCCFGRQTTLPWGITFPPGVEAPPGIPLHPTQIYSSLWEFLVLLCLLRFEKKHKPGENGRPLTFALWLILHGIGRACIEQFRGDFRGPSAFNLSVSTWLSGLAIGIGIFLFRHRRTRLRPL